jgi:hypothetical protein
MGVDELLERVRARRRLPPAGERRRIREAAGVSQHEVAKPSASAGPLSTAGSRDHAHANTKPHTRNCSRS